MNNQSDNDVAPSRTTVRIPTVSGDELEEINPAPGVWEFQIVSSGWLQLFESEINEPNHSVVRFESHDIEASRILASILSINVDQIETVPEAVKYFEFRTHFATDCRFMSCWRNHFPACILADYSVHLADFHAARFSLGL